DTGWHEFSTGRSVDPEHFGVPTPAPEQAPQTPEQAIREAIGDRAEELFGKIPDNYRAQVMTVQEMIESGKGHSMQDGLTRPRAIHNPGAVAAEMAIRNKIRIEEDERARIHAEQGTTYPSEPETVSFPDVSPEEHAEMQAYLAQPDDAPDPY